MAISPINVLDSDENIFQSTFSVAYPLKNQNTNWSIYAINIAFNLSSVFFRKHIYVTAAIQ